MLNPQSTKSNNKQELRNILEQIEKNGTSPRSGESITRNDITPDIILQRDIFKKVSGVENPKEVLNKILQMRIIDNQSLEDIDTLNNFKDGATDKILNEVYMQVYNNLSNDINVLKALMTKIENAEAQVKLSSENLSKLKKNYKECLKRLDFKNNFLKQTKEKFKDVIFFEEISTLDSEQLEIFTQRQNDKPIPSKSNEISRIQDALEYWFLLTDKLRNEEDNDVKREIKDDTDEPTKQKQTHTNFYYSKEYTIQDTGIFLDNNADYKHRIKDNAVSRSNFKFKRTARIFMLEEDQYSPDFESMLNSFLKYANYQFSDYSQSHNSWFRQNKDIRDRKSKQNIQSEVVKNVWDVYQNKEGSINDELFFPQKPYDKSHQTKFRQFQYDTLDGVPQWPNNEQQSTYILNKSNFPQQDSLINDIKLRLKSTHIKENEFLPVDMNYSCISITVKDVKYYLVGFGQSMKEQASFNRLSLFNTETQKWARCTLKMFKDGEILDQNEEDVELYLQSPSTCFQVDKKKEPWLQMFGGQVNKNKQSKEMFKFDLSKLDMEHTEIVQEIINQDDKDEIRARSQTKNMVQLPLNGLDLMFIQGGAIENDDTIESLSDLNSYDIKNCIMENVTHIEPPRANHFFEKKDNDEILVAFGFDQARNVPLNDFQVQNVIEKLCQNACIDFNFLPEQNMAWTQQKSDYIVVFGGKVHGMLMVLDVNKLENSVLQQSKGSAANHNVIVKKSEYEVDYSKAKQTHANSEAVKGGKKDAAKPKGKDQQDVEDIKQLNTYIHDRGGIMVSKRDLIILPNYKDKDKLHFQDMVFTYDFHLYLN